MTLFDWHNKSGRQRVFLVLTLVVVVLLAPHPELRLLLPLVDALGLELLLLLIGSQLLDYARPALHAALRNVIRPTAKRAYAFVLYMLGIAGPYVGGRVVAWRGGTGALALRD